MATKTIKRTIKAKPTVDEPVVESVENTETIEEKIVEAKPREFDKADGIPCESITSGELGIVGLRTNTPYYWVNCGDVITVEYQDLVAALNARTDAIMRPRFIVKDEDFITKYPVLNELYTLMYTKGDLRDILNLPPEQMAKVIESLPLGVKDAIKGLAATMIEDGRIDSRKTIKKLDEIFNMKFSILAEN